MKLPAVCLECKKDQCPLHCLHLGDRIKVQGIANVVPIPKKKIKERKMAGTY